MTTTTNHELFEKLQPLVDKRVRDDFGICHPRTGSVERNCSADDIRQSCYLAIWERIVDCSITSETEQTKIDSLIRNEITAAIRQSKIIDCPRGQEIHCVSLNVLRSGDDDDIDDEDQFDIIDDDDTMSLLEQFEELSASCGSAREHECLMLLMDGHNRREIAAQMGVSEVWISHLIHNIRDRAQSRR